MQKSIYPCRKIGIEGNVGVRKKPVWRSAGTPGAAFALFAPYALNQRSPAEGKGKGQKLLAQGNALGFHGPQTRRPVRAKALKPDD